MNQPACHMPRYAHTPASLWLDRSACVIIALYSYYTAGMGNNSALMSQWIHSCGSDNHQCYHDLCAYSHCIVAAGKAGSKVREAIFKYLERFLKDLGPERAHKYCAQVINTCLFAYKREDSNPAKSATFLPLQCILDWRLPVPDDSTVSELARTYQSSYQRLKSLTGSVKGDILQTLGQLLEARPQVSNPLRLPTMVALPATTTRFTPMRLT